MLTSRHNILRNQRGDFLVEALFGALIAAVIIGAVMHMYVRVRQGGNLIEKQMCAATVAQEAVDNLRAQPFSVLTTNLGTHTPMVDGSGQALGFGHGIGNGGGQGTGDSLFPRPLLKDGNLDYTGNGDAKVEKSKHNAGLQTVDPVSGAFTNTLTVTLTQNGGANAPVNVDVIISWLDTTGKPRTYRLRSLITSDGLSG